MISNRMIKLRARQIFPKRSALLVGPSRLLRGDKVRGPHIERPRDQSTEWGLLVRNRRFHHTKRDVKTLPGIRSAVACIESNSCHTCREGQRRRPIKQPILRSLPKRSIRFFAPANERSLSLLDGSRKGGVERPELAMCRRFAAAPLGRRSGRRSDLISAAQHLKIERRTILPGNPRLDHERIT